VKFFGTGTGKVTSTRGSPPAVACAASASQIDSGVSRRTGAPQPRQKTRAARA
jgi:hypothetical protein